MVGASWAAVASESKARRLPLPGRISLCTAGCHLCSAHLVRQEGTELIAGWSPWQLLTSPLQKLAGRPAWGCLSMGAGLQTAGERGEAL